MEKFLCVRKSLVKYQFSIKVIFSLYKVMENKFKKIYISYIYIYIIKVKNYNEKYYQFIKKKSK